MLRQVRAHVQGLRLHDTLSNSPLTIVYQCIGNVKAAQLEDSLRADVSGSPDGLSAMPVSFRVKNSLAGATGRPDVAAFLQATNVVVGWHLSPASTVPTASTSSPSTSISSSSSLAVPIRQEDRLAKLVADAAASRAPGPIRQPPQRTLAALIKASLDLSNKFPVAPLAGFFHGERLSLSHLARWGELDDATVYAELIGQLGAAPAGLVAQLSFGDGGISALLDAQSGPLLAALAARQAESGAAGGAPAAAGGAV